jgi:hypothetical protein
MVLAFNVSDRAAGCDNRSPAEQTLRNCRTVATFYRRGRVYEHCAARQR